MRRQARKYGFKGLIWLFVAVVYSAAVTNGVCLCGKFLAGGDDRGTSLVSIDVCGAGQTSMMLQSLDSQALADAVAELYFPSITLIPPAPELAVASACPGDTGRPPEA